MTILSQTKYSLLPVMIFIFAGPQIGFAQSSDSLSNLYACEQVVGDAAQLACFQVETAKIRASETALGSYSIQKERLAIDEERQRLSIERQSLAAEKESFAEAKKPAFHETFGKKSDAPKIQSVAITKTETLRGSRHIRFTLANGEVWKQTEFERVRLGRASPDVLVIKKGVLGGYMGKVNDRLPTFRLKRVK